MATRLYLPSSGTAPVSPTPQAGWNQNAGSVIRRPTFPYKTGTAQALSTVTGGGVSGDNWILLQFVSPPLLVDGSVSTTSTFSFSIYCMESNNLANAYVMVRPAYCNNDGSGDVTIMDDGSDWYVGATEMATTTNGASRYDSESILSNATITAGKRLLFEVGFDKNSTTSYSMKVRCGDDGASDAPSSDADTSTTNNSWVEFSDNFTFDYGGPNALMMRGVGI